MPDRPVRAAVDQVRAALRERLLDEEQGCLDPPARRVDPAGRPHSPAEGGSPDEASNPGDGEELAA